MYGSSPYQSYSYPTNYNSMPSYGQRAYGAQQQPTPQAQPQIQPQMQMQMTQPITPMDMPIQDIKYVNKAQAEAYIAYPNTKVMLIDKESGLVYIKTADGMGQSKTDYFRFEPINADGSPIKPQEPIPQVNLDDYIKREDLGKLGLVSIEQFNQLSQKIEQIQKQISGGKPNVGTKQATQ